jgi:hypothetical protein
MKTVETPGGVPVFINTLENKVYECIIEETCKSDLSERDAYIAQQLVNKGILSRVVKEGKTYYKRRKGSL